MTEPPTVPDSSTSESTSSTRWTLRLLAACMLLTGLAFIQAPGLQIADTKFDLVADPLHFLSRSLHLWDPSGALGQLQNQAYGYLLPVGPFHAVLLELGLPAWVVQRLWWSVVVCVAFLGVWRLVRALRMGSAWAAYAAAFAYALTPRMLSEVTITSVEVWPMALAPWVLLPLVSRAPLTWWGRIWRSALAVALVGGVNAVATGAVLVLPTLWFLTRRWTRELLLAGLAWLAAVVLAMGWWLVPLLVMGRHSPPFLDWIESAATTTLVAGPTEVLRGTSHWLSHLVTPAGPSWPAGRQYVDSPLLVVASLAIALVGLVALTQGRTPHRWFLAVGLGTGLLLVGAGHTGALAGVLAEPVQTLLDGPLAAFRNTHKFELVVRLPLVLLLASALTQAARWARQAEVHRALVPFTAACLVVAAGAPAVASTLPRPGGYEQIAPHWVEVADYLDAQPGAGTVLVVPATPFAEHTWGVTRDEPLQALMDRPFAVRDAVPLGGAGSTRWLDEIQRRLGSGDGGPELAQALARGGVGWVVVRNDLTLSAQETPPIAPHQALVAAGLERVADFGPAVGPAGETDSHTVRQRTIVPTPSVQVYAVPDPAVARLVPLPETRLLTGGPEDVPGLTAGAPAYLLDDAASALGGDLDAALAGVPVGGTVVSDGYRRRAVNFGRAASNVSGMMTAGQEEPARAVNDYLLPGLGDPAVLQWPEPIAAVTASSSLSDADVLGPPVAGHDPWRALDGNDSTAWASGGVTARGQWWEVQFTMPQDLGDQLHIRVASPAFYAPVQAWQVETDAGVETTTVPPGRLTHDLVLPRGATSRVRLTVLETPGTAASAGLAEVELPGLAPVAPSLRVRAGTGVVDVISLRAQQLGRSACLVLGQRPLCAGLQSAPAEEADGLHRTVTLDTGGAYAVSGQVLPVDGDAVEDLLQVPGQVEVTASSRDILAPYGRPDTVVDGDPGTGWVAGPLDGSPTLRLTLPEPRTVRGLRMISDYYLAGSRPAELVVSLDGGEPMELTLGEGSTVVWEETEVSTVEVTFGATFPVTTADPLVPGSLRVLPVGVSEITLLGAEQLTVPDPDRQLSLECGSGPELVVNGTTVQTRVTATARAVLERSRLDLAPCGQTDTVDLVPGSNTITAAASDAWLPVDLTLVRADAPAARPGAGTRLGLTRPTPASVEVTLPARTEVALVVLAQNAGPGWSADLVTDDGGRTPLTPLVVDGWQQAFVAPAGDAGTVEARFGPDGTHRLGLAGGLLALLALVAGGLLWHPGRPVRPLPAASPTLPERVGLVLLLAVLFAGLWGLGLGLLALLVTRSVDGRTRATLVTVVGLAGAALLAWFGPVPHGGQVVDVLPQVLVLLSVLLALAGAAQAGTGTRQTLPSRRGRQRRG